MAGDTTGPVTVAAYGEPWLGVREARGARSIMGDRGRLTSRPARSMARTATSCASSRTAKGDGIFEPARETRRWAEAVADDLGLPNDWLNDGAKGYPPLFVGAAPGSFSPDGRSFATTGGQRSARIWDTASGLPVTPRLMHDAQVLMVRFSPDGRRVVTASEDGTARVWDAGSGALIGPPLAHPAGMWVLVVAFSPDGSRIVTVAGDHKARVWDAASNQLQAAERQLDLPSDDNYIASSSTA